MKRTTVVLPVLAAMFALGACSKKPQPAGAPPPAAAPARDDDAARREAEERARREAEERARREAMARAQSILASAVFFDYDSFSIREDSRQALDAKLPVLQGDPTISLVIAGHADERGSTEYNLALGMRRASATRDYLASYGIDASRLEVTSFGKEQPLDAGSNEAAWARNRRAEFQVGRQGTQ